MTYIRPKPLKQGDTIAFIAPAGVVKNLDNINRAKTFLETKGFKVIFSKHLFNQHNYMSDTDGNRLYDLHWAFSNPEINAIICARGGYGCLRLINKIDYELISSNPKPFCGYSDITILSALLLKKANLITYSSPMANGDFGAMEISNYTIDNFFKTVSNQEPQTHKAEKIYNSGKSKGTLLGGNLASIVSLCGTDFIPDEKFILFAEDLNEPVYKIDRMITQLLNIPKFKNNLAGLAFGEFIDSGYPEQLDELFTSTAKCLNLPAIGGLKISHNKDKMTLPIGAEATIINNTLSF